MAELLQAMYEYGVKFVLLVVIMVLGINIGKFLRIRKNAKNDEK